MRPPFSPDSVKALPFGPYQTQLDADPNVRGVQLRWLFYLMRLKAMPLVAFGEGIVSNAVVLSFREPIEIT